MDKSAILSLIALLCCIIAPQISRAYYYDVKPLHDDREPDSKVIPAPKKTYYYDVKPLHDDREPDSKEIPDSKQAYYDDVKPLHDDRQPDYIKAPDSRWRTPSGTVQQITQGYSPLAGTQIYPFKGGQVIITKILYADYIMTWSKGSDQVKIHKHLNGNITQEWYFGDSVHIKLTRSKKFEKQTWKMENTTMHYIRNRKSGSTTLQWENNVEDFASVQKYQGFISSWCAENASWVKARCNINTIIEKK